MWVSLSIYLWGWFYHPPRLPWTTLSPLEAGRTRRLHVLIGSSSVRVRTHHHHIIELSVDGCLSRSQTAVTIYHLHLLRLLILSLARTRSVLTRSDVSVPLVHLRNALTSNHLPPLWLPIRTHRKIYPTSSHWFDWGELLTGRVGCLGEGVGLPEIFRF